MDVSLFAVKLVRRIRKGGLQATLGDAYRILFPPRAPDEFDLKYGTDTGGIDPLWKFKISSPNARYGVGSQSVKERNLVEAIELVPEDLQTFTFVDLGCGRGRALLIAARLAFKQVIGVEFVHELAETARENLQRVGAAKAVVLERDAADYRFPEGNVMLFLFNPFSQEVMSKVIANLGESLARKIYVIYFAPVCAALLDASGFLRRVGGGIPGERGIQLWKSVRQNG